MNHVILNANFPGEPVALQRHQMSGKMAFTPEKSRRAKETLQWQLKAAAPRLKPTAAWLGVQLVFTVHNMQQDGDNLTKLVWDAFNGMVWCDDAQIVEWTGKKVRAAKNQVGSTRIVVYTIEGAQ
jgi:Holliday junction resolvase RusA-like endonuclease